MRKKKYKVFQCNGSGCKNIVYIKYWRAGLSQDSHEDSPNEGLMIGKRCFCRSCACNDDDLNLENFLSTLDTETNLSTAGIYANEETKKSRNQKSDNFRKLLDEKMKKIGIKNFSPYEQKIKK